MIEQEEIKLALPGDANQIAEMSRDLIEQGLGWSWTRHRVLRAIRDPECNVVVVRAGPKVVAFGIMEYGWETAHLLLFAVLPEVRRKQVGSRLLAWLEETALVAGVERIILEARSQNKAARRFYGVRGYREVGRVPGYYRGRETAVRLSRRLRPITPVA